MKKVIKQMKIVLLKDFPQLGQKGEIKFVRPGYARNFLIPARIAVLFQDPQAQALFKESVQERKKALAQKEEIAQKITALKDKKIIFKVKVNKKGQPYKAIQTREIAQKLKVNQEMVGAEPIKTLGEHQVTIKSGDTQVKVVVEVKKEE